MSAPEKDLEALVLYSFGLEFPGRHALWKHHADQYTGAGHPDFYGHACGIYLALELKVSPNRFSEQQASRLNLIEASGGLGFGLLEERKPNADSDYWLIAPSSLLRFSYRANARTQWLPIPVRMSPTPKGMKKSLDLLTLHQFIQLRKKLP